MIYVLLEYESPEEDEPRLVYAQLDDSRREVRRAEFYPNGLCFACGGEYGREEALSPVPYPEDLRSLSRPGEVAARAIPASVFQTVWGQAQERPDGLFGMFA